MDTNQRGIGKFRKFKKIGKIRHYGLSNETAWGIMKFIMTSYRYNFSKPASIQNGYNLINRVFDISNSEVSIRENCGLIAYSPLAGGRLSENTLIIQGLLTQDILYGQEDFQDIIHLEAKKQY